MANKKKKSNLKVLKSITYIAIAMGIFSCFLYGYLPMMKSTVSIANNTNLYSGFAMIFGGEATVEWSTLTINDITQTGIRYIDVNFNTVAFIGFIAVVLGVIVSLLQLAIKSIHKNKIIGLLSALLILSGGIGMICVRDSALTAMNINKALQSLYEIGYGAIISGIMAIISGVSIGVINFLKK